MLSFDITDRNIRIIKGVESSGKIRISSAATLNLEEEVIVNGHVKDVARLATLINQVLRTNRMLDKEAIVSISSNLTIFKELHVPKAKEQEFVKMVRAEMQAALGIDDSYSVSYVVVGEGDGSQPGQEMLKVLATACPYEVVDCYKRLFNMLSLNLRSVMIGCNCITKVLLSDAKIKSKMPLLAVQIDNNFISLNLYEKGQLSFSRFASISAEDYGNSPDYVFEAVNENIFRMMQFQKSKNNGDVIENVVFYGDTHEYVRLTNALEQMGVRTSIINVPPQIHGYENLEFSSYANAIGAMFKRNREVERVNLLETDTVNNNKIKSDKSYTGLLVGAIVLTSVVMMGIFGGLCVYNGMIKSDISDYEDKLKSDLTVQRDEQRKTLIEEKDQVNAYRNGVLAAKSAFASRPYMLGETYTLIDTTITDAATEMNLEVKITQFDFSEGKLDFTLQLDADEDPSQTLPALIIERLTNLTDDLHTVDYTGYKLDKDGTENPTDPKDIVRYSFTAKMKGDGIKLDGESSETEGEAK